MEGRRVSLYRRTFTGGSPSFGLLSCCRTSERVRLDASICGVALLTLKFKQEKMDHKRVEEHIYPGAVQRCSLSSLETWTNKTFALNFSLISGVCKQNPADAAP